MSRKKKQQAPTFAERLRQLVEESDMTQGEIARRAGVSPQVVSRLLAAGNADVTLSIACRLAWAIGKGVAEFEEAVFEEWKRQPQTLELVDCEMSRGRLRQKLNAAQDRINDWEAKLPSCAGDEAEQITRRWMEGMIRHWRREAESLAARLRESDQT